MSGTRLTKWTFRRIDAVGVAVCVAGALLFYMVSVNPIMHRKDSLVARQAYLDTRRQNTAKLAERAAAMKVRLAQTRRALARIPIKLEPVHHMNDRIARLTDAATASGLAIHEICPGEIAHGAKHTMVPIRLVGKGTYQAWAAFLHQLTGQFPDTAVESFQLAGSPSDPAKPAQFEIHLVWCAAPGRVAAVK